MKKLLSAFVLLLALLLALSAAAFAYDEEEEDGFEEDDEELESLRVMALNLEKGIGATSVPLTMGESTATVDILPESGRRNVNKLEDEDWEELLDQCGVPEEKWPDLIDCFMDWTDEGDEHRLNGAEEDDAYYKEKGYKPKNAPLDTVDELLEALEE